MDVNFRQMGIDIAAGAAGYFVAGRRASMIERVLGVMLGVGAGRLVGRAFRPGPADVGRLPEPIVGGAVDTRARSRLPGSSSPYTQVVFVPPATTSPTVVGGERKPFVPASTAPPTVVGGERKPFTGSGMTRLYYVDPRTVAKEQAMLQHVERAAGGGIKEQPMTIGVASPSRSAPLVGSMR